MSAAKIGWWHTEMGESEKARLLEAFEAKSFSCGRFAQEFETNFARMIGVPYAVLMPSGTAAITGALLAAGIKAGDEVLLPSLTWIATANAADIVGAKVSLVDCREDTTTVSIDAWKEKITPSTKAVIIVHLNGKAGAIQELREYTKKKGIVLIEDTCKAMCSSHHGQNLGTFADFSCYSLGMISLVSMGYGGVVCTSSAKAYETLKHIRNQGVPAQMPERYLHKSFNFKVSDLLAAIGLAQLERVPEKLKNIKNIYLQYLEGLNDCKSLIPVPVNLKGGEIPLCVEYTCVRREELISYMQGHGVELLRFHISVNHAPYLHASGVFPNAERFAEQGVILPCGPARTSDEVARVIELIRTWERGLS